MRHCWLLTAMISSVLLQTLRISALLSCIKSMRYAGATEFGTQGKKTLQSLWDDPTLNQLFCPSLISRKGNVGDAVEQPLPLCHLKTKRPETGTLRLKEPLSVFAVME